MSTTYFLVNSDAYRAVSQLPARARGTVTLDRLPIMQIDRLGATMQAIYPDRSCAPETVFYCDPVVMDVHGVNILPDPPRGAPWARGLATFDAWRAFLANMDAQSETVVIDDMGERVDPYVVLHAAVDNGTEQLAQLVRNVGSQEARDISGTRYVDVSGRLFSVTPIAELTDRPFA